MRTYLLATTAAVLLWQSHPGSAQHIARDMPAAVVAGPPARAARSTAAVPEAAEDPAKPPVQTLREALIWTYKTSPALMAQRAALRGLDSGAALVRAEGRPQIDTSVGFEEELYTTRRPGALGRNLNASADVEQILFAGGRIRNSIKAADGRVIAGRADLRATEGDVLAEAVGAYADLVRDRAVRDFTLNQVSVLDENLVSTRSRFRVGDLTRADVAQSEVRLSLAQGGLAVAEGRVQSSEENFERVVGTRAGKLEPLPSLPLMPQTAEQAVDLAVANNADVAALVARARAAGHVVSATRAERLPTISAVGATGYSNALGTADVANGLPRGTLPNSATNIGAGLALRLPLYQGGAASARVRVAEEARAVLVEQAILFERQAVANARAAFAVWRGSVAAIAANEAAVASSEVALRSLKIEQSVGSRNIIDVLNAQQEVLGSRIALANAERDAYVAAYTLLNTMGVAEAASLDLGVDRLYDPRANYRTYGRTWSDWADGPRYSPGSTRTVPEGASGPLSRLDGSRLATDDLRP